MIGIMPLVKMCQANPEDAAPLLVLADWLDEQGRCDEAELIRVQAAYWEPEFTESKFDDLFLREVELMRRCRGSEVLSLLRMGGWEWTPQQQAAYMNRKGIVQVVEEDT